MLTILAKTLPLMLASTLSPGILAVALVLLGEKIHPKLKCIALLIGSLLVAIILGILGLTVGKNIQVNQTQTLESSITDIIFGLVFLIWGIYIIAKKEKQVKVHEENKNQYLRWFLIGLIGSATNFDAALLLFTAAKEIGSSGIDVTKRIIATSIGAMFFVLPILLPLILYTVMPKIAAKILEPVNSFIKKYARFLVGAIFIIFAIIFLLRGIKFF